MQNAKHGTDRLCPACCVRARELGVTDICPWVAEMSEIIGHVVDTPAGMRQLALIAPCNSRKRRTPAHRGPVSNLSDETRPSLQLL